VRYSFSAAANVVAKSITPPAADERGRAGIAGVNVWLVTE
jgi:hypothetical protein